MALLWFVSWGSLLLSAVPPPPAGVLSAQSPERLQAIVPAGHVDLCGEWGFQADPGGIGEQQRWFDESVSREWSPIHVPGSWQAQGYGVEYHGVGWYRRTFTVPQEWAGRQAWLRFGGVATSARVWVNGQLVGGHVGNWDPFSVCISPAIRTDRLNTLVVRVEELPKHFSAGFARVPGVMVGKDGHFGGLWQEVSLYQTGAAQLEDVFVRPDLASSQALLEANVAQAGSDAGRLVCTLIDPDGQEIARREESWGAASRPHDLHPLRLSLPVPHARPWSPESPVLYTARVEAWVSGRLSDRRDIRFGMREISRRGHQILLNGEPIYIRGMLHWGYYPHLFNIAPSEEQVRREFRDLRAAGFNLVKVCLFVFPARFYELADETGMLVWQEYPTWLTLPKKDNLGPHDHIVKEYAQWLRFDRNHPSIILRSLTCEAPDPHPGLVEELYAQAKEMTGGGMVEDNSAYMNQVRSDWFDAHMYIDLDEYHLHLAKLAGRVRGMPEIKPYLSGEEMDCDTYRDMAAIRRELIKDGQTPWWLDNDNFKLQEQVEQELIARHGPQTPAELVRRQNRHALITRKGYIEDFRRYPELAGFVVCCIRDITATRPGFYDDLLRVKWPADDWRAFIGERALVLDSPRQSNCFIASEPIDIPVLVSNFGEALHNAPLEWELKDGDEVLAHGQAQVEADRGTIVPATRCTLAPGTHAPRPRKLLLSARLGSEGAIARNEWPVWLFPVRQGGGGKVFVHSEHDSTDLARSIGPEAVAVTTAADRGQWMTAASQPVELNASAAILVTDSLAEPVLDALRQGARVIYLADHRSEYLPHANAPFWRETAIWLPSGHPALADFPHDGFVDRQFYDLTQRRPFDTTQFRPEIQPLVWGVNARFNKRRMVDYLFEARVGQGRLLACCLKLGGGDHVAGQHLLDCLVNYAASDQFLDTAPSESVKLLQQIRNRKNGSP